MRSMGISRQVSKPASLQFLQRIKKENGNQENRELGYQLKGVIAKLSSMGVNVKDLTM